MSAQQTEGIYKYRNLAINLAVICVAVIAGYYLYQQQDKRLLKLKQDKELELKKNSLLANIKTQKKEYKELKDAVNRKDVSQSIRVISEIAKNADVKLVGIRPSPEFALHQFIVFPYELRVDTDSYHDLGKLISMLENHPDVYNVDTVSVARQLIDTPEGQALKLSVSLRVSTMLIRD